MKLSEVNLTFVKEYLRQDNSEDDALIQLLLDASKDYIVNYTGLSLEQLEQYQDVCIAVLVLVAEFYDNRTISINDKLNLRVNTMLESLLSRHSINLI